MLLVPSIDTLAVLIDFTLLACCLNSVEELQLTMGQAVDALSMVVALLETFEPEALTAAPPFTAMADVWTVCVPLEIVMPWLVELVPG